MTAKESHYPKGAFIMGDVHIMPGSKAHALLEADKPVPREYGGTMSAATAAKAILIHALRRADEFYRLPAYNDKPKEETTKPQQTQVERTRPNIGLVIPRLVRIGP